MSLRNKIKEHSNNKAHKVFIWINFTFLFLSFFNASSTLGQIQDYKGSIYLGIRNSQVKSDVDNIPLELPIGMGSAFGLGLTKPIYGDYHIGLGLEAGIFNLRVRPEDHPFSELAHQFYYIHIPLYIQRVFPISYRFSIMARSGISLNALVSSLGEISGTNLDNGSELTLKLRRNIMPMPGILFSAGLDYDLMSGSTLTFCIFWNPVLFAQLNMDYTYQVPEENVTYSGTLWSQTGGLGCSLILNFNVSALFVSPNDWP